MTAAKVVIVRVERVIKGEAILDFVDTVADDAEIVNFLSEFGRENREMVLGFE